jgi:hypothetical protein
MKPTIGVAVLILGSIFPSLAVAQGLNLKLHPNGFGPDSYAAWKAKRGQPDSEGEGDHALYFQKMTTTATVAAGIAVITGFKGQAIPAAMLTGLSWEHRFDNMGHCGAGAPRWNVQVTGASGTKFTLFLGCAAATHTPSPGDPANWLVDSYGSSLVILTVGAANAGLTASLVDIMAGTLTGLAIVFDEGTDQGTGFVDLDNITVTIGGVSKVWTGPMDNGN